MLKTMNSELKPSASRWPRLSILPFHPVLLAIYFCLALYAHNIHELYFSEVQRALALAAISGFFVTVVFCCLLRSLVAGGIAASLLIVCLAAYGYVYDTIENLIGGSAAEPYFMLIWIGCFAIGISRSFIHRSKLIALNGLMNCIALAMVVLPIGSILWDNIHFSASAKVTVNRPSLPEIVSPVGNNATFPDIYYLVFDRYASRQTLTKHYGFDNSVFLNSLRKRGFYILEDGVANYAKSAHSLASSLNLGHLTEVFGPASESLSDWKPILSLVRDNQLGYIVKSLGYHYAHIGSWWYWTRGHDAADESGFAEGAPLYLRTGLKPFEALLLKVTLPARIYRRSPSSVFDDRRTHWNIARFQFDVLPNLEGSGEPLFVVGHILMPHEPYVIFPDGRFKTREEAAVKTRQENYLDQLAYTNRKIIELIDSLLRREPQPIIILQSDEGPNPDRFKSNSGQPSWHNASQEELRKKLRILNAFYFPDQDYAVLYPDLTPVNTFRLIFNRYLGQTLPLLPDRTYVHRSRDAPYALKDVTDIVR